MRRDVDKCEGCGAEVDTSPHSGIAWTEQRKNDPNHPGFQERKYWCPECSPNA